MRIISEGAVPVCPVIMYPQNGVFNTNGQFNFTIFEKIMDVKDNQPYIYPVDTDITQVENSSNRQISLRIVSYPSTAEVYVNRKPGKRVSPSAKTPALFPRLKNPAVEVTLFKKGYTDTTILMNLLSGKVNQTEITLNKIKPEIAAAQNKFLHERTPVHIGKTCLISTPFFAIGGGGAGISFRKKIVKKPKTSMSVGKVQ